MLKKLLSLIITGSVMMSSVPVIANAATVKSDTSQIDLQKASTDLSDQIKVPVTGTTTSPKFLCSSKYGDVYTAYATQEDADSYGTVYFFTINSNSYGNSSVSILGFANYDLAFNDVDKTLVLPDSIAGMPVTSVLGLDKVVDENYPDNYVFVLEHVVLGDNVTSIGDWAFCNFKNLTSVSGKGLSNFNFKKPVSIGIGAFMNDPIEYIASYDKSISHIGAGAFDGTALKGLAISNITDIECNAFSECKQLTNVSWVLDANHMAVVDGYVQNAKDAIGEYTYSGAYADNNLRSGIFAYDSNLEYVITPRLYRDEFIYDASLKCATVLGNENRIPDNAFYIGGDGSSVNTHVLTLSFAHGVKNISSVGHSGIYTNAVKFNDAMSQDDCLSYLNGVALYDDSISIYGLPPVATETATATSNTGTATATATETATATSNTETATATATSTATISTDTATETSTETVGTSDNNSLGLTLTALSFAFVVFLKSVKNRFSHLVK